MGDERNECAGRMIEMQRILDQWNNGCSTAEETWNVLVAFVGQELAQGGARERSTAPPSHPTDLTAPLSMLGDHNLVIKRADGSEVLRVSSILDGQDVGSLYITSSASTFHRFRDDDDAAGSGSSLGTNIVEVLV